MKLSQSQLQQLYQNACLDELQAIKPGNVHVFADGHGMTVQDFMRSAQASGEQIASPELTLGQRILLAVDATQQAVGCNTNLGIILLCAPLMQAALMNPAIPLRQRLQTVLHDTTVEDCNQVFHAIALANPAGLGVRAQHDIRQEAAINLLEAMQLAQETDLVAYQYYSDYADIFTLGLPVYRSAIARDNAIWAVTRLYLTYLSERVDSHVFRKSGTDVAFDLKKTARTHLTEFNRLDNPKHYLGALLKWDNALKQNGINPGTCADLTVATILAHQLLVAQDSRIIKGKT